MRILLLTDAFPPEIRSSSLLMRELAEDLSQAGHIVTVLTCQPRYNLAEENSGNSLPLQRETIPGMETVRVATPAIHNVGHWRRGLGQLSLPLLFYRAARKLSPPQIILCYSPPLPLALAAQWLARRWNVPWILNLQDLFPQNAIDLGALRNPLLIRFFRRMEQSAFFQCSAITVHSTGNADWLRRQGVAEQKIYVIPNWVDAAQYQTADKTSVQKFRTRAGGKNCFLVLFAGVMGHAQDLNVIVEAAANLQDTPGIKFVLAGDGAARKWVETQIVERNLRNVQLLPFVPPEEYPALVMACDAGLVTLRKEMTTPVVPSKLFSLMAAGLPVLLSVNEQSDARRIAGEAYCGKVLPPGDNQALAEAIRSLANNKEQAEELGRNGQRFAEKHFDKKNCTGQYAELLERLANRKAAPQAANR